MSAALPLAAMVVVHRAKRGGERIWETEPYYVRSVRGGGWEPCRQGSIDTPLRITSGEFAVVQRLSSAPHKALQDAAREMWTFIRQRASESGVWLVDDDLPEELRVGVNLMPLERAFAVHDTIALTRRPKVEVEDFLVRHAQQGKGKRGTSGRAAGRSPEVSPDAWMKLALAKLVKAPGPIGDDELADELLGRGLITRVSEGCFAATPEGAAFVRST